MSAHTHTTPVPGCYRCELGRDEAMSALAEERDELREALRDAADYLRLGQTWIADADRHAKMGRARDRALAVLDA
jgi:hypothetical protein